MEWWQQEGNGLLTKKPIQAQAIPGVSSPKGPRVPQHGPADSFGEFHNLVEKVEREISEMKEDEVPVIDIEMAVTRKFPEISGDIDVGGEPKDKGE
jgi:hypothetical protein